MVHNTPSFVSRLLHILTHTLTISQTNWLSLEFQCDGVWLQRPGGCKHSTWINQQCIWEGINSSGAKMSKLSIECEKRKAKVYKDPSNFRIRQAIKLNTLDELRLN